MQKEELIKMCLFDEDSLLTYPFKKDLYSSYPVLRHKSNNKWFGLIFEMDGNLCINLKAKPIDILLLREQYPTHIKQAWHMNKTHWCTIFVNDIEIEVLNSIIRNSFEITLPKKKRKK